MPLNTKNTFLLSALMLLNSPFSLHADDLRALLKHALENNNLVLSKTLSYEAKQHEVEAKKSAYYPTLDIGASYQSLNARSPYMPGDVYGGYASLGLDVYDGGKKSSLLSQKKHEQMASSHDIKATKENISLQIVQDFYQVKSLETTLTSRNEAKNSLKAQLYRMTKFYEAKVATSDDVDRLQAAYDTNIYEIESLKLQILSTLRSLELKVGKKITTLEDSHFKDLLQKSYENVDAIKSLMSQEDAMLSSADAIDSIYYPQLRLEDTYSLYGYDRTDAFHPEGADRQNKLLLTLNLRLFDNGSIQQEKQAVIIHSQALNEQIAYQKEEQRLQYDIALSRIKTSKVKITSAKSALVSATSAFKTIEKKYNAGIVDNVVYLDALSSQTSAKALYETSLNDLEVAYAIYYYYAGKEIGEFLQ